MIDFRQSTASQEVLLGPFVDETDGKTPETALSIAASDIKIWKNGATTLANKNSGGATHISGGYYYAVLDATDTDTIGPAEITCNMAGALPLPPKNIRILDEAVFDVIYGTTAISTLAAGALMGLSDGAITSAKFGAGAINAAAIAADAIGASELAADAASEIATAVRTELATELARVDAAISTRGTGTALDAAGVRTAIGLASANLDTQLTAIDDYLDTEVGAIKAKTDNLPASPAATGDCLTAAGVRTAVGLAAANLDTQLAALPTATETATEILGTAVDTGVSVEKALEMLAAFVAGKVSASSAGGVTTLSYKKRNGTTVSFTCLGSETDGTRVTTGSLS